MRILFMTQVLPLPLDAGPKVRAYYVLRYLVEAGHEVHLLSFVRPGESPQHVDALRSLCASVEAVPIVRSRARNLLDAARSLAGSVPFLVLRDQTAAMQDRQRQVLASRSFDAVHADQIWMAPYGLCREAPELRVLDQHNATFLVPRRLAEHQRNPLARMFLGHEAGKLAAFEQETCRRYGRVVWVTAEDRKAVGTSGANGAPEDPVIPIATDPRALQPVVRRSPFRVTFLGGLHWPPNREGVAWFAERVWPQVARAVPSAVLTIIGREGADALPRTVDARRIDVTGYVVDPQPYLSETAAFVVPLHSGAGMRVKILEAWSWALPIVSTTVGAEGLAAIHGENMLLADEPQLFADAVIRVLQDARLAAALGAGGRSTAESSYDWTTVYRAWDGIYRRSRPELRLATSTQTGRRAGSHPEDQALSVPVA
jgi:glycosyltransferase involved in cell wall biosynthesis